jgi:hypothetical protein
VPQRRLPQTPRRAEAPERRRSRFVVNITNGEMNGTKLAMTLRGAFGATDAYCARKKAPTTGKITGVATLPKSSVREISEAAAA